MRQRSVLFGIAGVGLLLIGLVSGLVLGGALAGRPGAARAQAAVLTTTGAAHLATGDPSANAYCQVYEHALASNLHTSATTLEAANVQALQQTLARMVSDGQITTTEQSVLSDMAAQLETNLCAHLNAQSMMGALAGNSVVTSQFLAARTALLGGTATALNLPSATLSGDLENGQTVAAIAQAQKVSLATVESAYLAAANTFLTQDVTNGVITTAQQQEISAMLQKTVAKGHFPLLDGGLRGMMGGAAG